MNKPATLESLILQLSKLEDQANELRGKLREFENSIDSVREELLLKMRGEGTSIARAGDLTVSAVYSSVPQVKDWDRLYAFVLRSKNIHLFERRLSSKAWKELLESRQGKAIPGVEPFQKVSLQVRRS